MIYKFSYNLMKLQEHFFKSFVSALGVIAAIGITVTWFKMLDTIVAFIK